MGPALCALPAEEGLRPLEALAQLQPLQPRARTPGARASPGTSSERDSVPRTVRERQAALDALAARWTRPSEVSASTTHLADRPTLETCPLRGPPRVG